jgi:LacI family transcriptional regulator
MAKPLNIREFARLAKVSPATVSRVFAGGKLVSVETRKTILALAEQHGYRPNYVARATFGGRSGTVGVFFSDLRISYCADIVAGLARELMNVDTLPISLDWRSGNERKSLQRLIDQRVDAIVLMPTDESIQRSELRTLTGRDIPLVTVDSPRRLALDSVRIDDAQGGRLAGEHLLSRGHRIFGFCYYGEGATACDLRLEGFRGALAAADVVLKDKNVARLLPHDDRRDELLRQQLKEILSRRDRPTAIFASTDLLAMEVYRVARAMKLRIPHDLSVVGFADLTFTPYIDPPLTTLHQDGVEVGRAAAKAVLERLDHPDAPETRVVLPTRLVVRESTAEPRATKAVAASLPLFDAATRNPTPKRAAPRKPRTE